MRPRSLEDFVGQTAAVGPGSLLRRLIDEDSLVTVIIWGPPGVGKTSLALVISEITSAHFEKLSAVTSGVADLRRVVDEATARREKESKRTIVLIDEIHRFNKAQQDALLPAVEDGRIVMIGTTTENPYFEVNSALLSRSRLIRLEPLTEEDIQIVVERALSDSDKGLGALRLSIEGGARDYIVKISKGDARVALNVLEAAAELSRGPVISLETAAEAARVPAVMYDKLGDIHFDVASAFIKSMRGSDPDAALYWLAAMIEGGEDPRFIARRMVIFASEDVGLADSNALNVATAAAHAVEYVGLPEARINLSHACIYLAIAPKSNSAYMAIDKALKAVADDSRLNVPAHLRDAHYPGAKKLGHGKGYKYPHSYPAHWVRQDYLPESAGRPVFYEAGDQGEEPAKYRAMLGRKRRAGQVRR